MIVAAITPSNQPVIYINDVFNTRQWYMGLGRNYWTELNTNTLCDVLTQRSIKISSWLTNNPNYHVVSVIPITADYPTAIS